MSYALLEVNHVSKTYPAASGAALHEVSLSLEPGELLALTGESGSGKTTLLKIIAGLEEPDTGAIRLNGQPVEGPSQRLVPGHPDIRVVFQDFRLLPNVSVLENIKYALRQYEVAYRERRLAEMLEMAKLDPVKDRLPRMLSGGEQQRAALAKALADEPALLLMDEPFSNLDSMLRRQLRQEIREMLQQSRCGVILVTHEPADALSMADRIMLLQAGGIVQTASPRDIYTYPANAYAAQFFGAANILPISHLLNCLQETTTGRKLAQRLQKHKTQVVCIRPEHIRLAAADSATLRGAVRAVRFLGSWEEVDVQLSGDQTLTLMAQPGLVKRGNPVGLQLEEKNLHFWPGEPLK